MKPLKTEAINSKRNPGWLQRGVRRMDWSDVAWIFGLLIVGSYCGWMTCELSQEIEEANVYREIITGSVISSGARMLPDDAVLCQNLDEGIVWRQSNLVTMTGKLHEHGLTLVWQTNKIAFAILAKIPPLPPAMPPIDKPADDGHRRDATKDPMEDVVPHNANPPNDPKLSHGANNRKREIAMKCKMKEQPPLAPARC